MNHGLHHRLLRTRARRAGLVSVLGVALAVGGALPLGVLSAGAAGTNGDRIDFPATVCTAFLAGSPLVQVQDLAAQAIVPNDAAQSAAYDATIPGGSTTLPSSGGGYPINELKDIGQTYLFRSSSGSPQVTGVAATGQALNNGNPVASSATFTNEGTTIGVSAAAWTSSPGGVLTFTTSSPHGLVQNQLIDTTGFGKAAYNLSGALVSGTPSTTTFTVTGRALPIANATWSGGELTFTTSVRHGLKVGDLVTTANSTPSAYNRGAANQAVTAVLSPTTFTMPGPASEPNPITVKGAVYTLGNPGTSGATLGSVKTLTTATVKVDSAQPGTLDTPDATVSLVAPAANATVTSYLGAITVTANLQTGAGPQDAATVCTVPHADPQEDGLSATLVGTGGPTTSSNPTCRPPDVCATTTTTTPPAPTVTSVSPSTGPTTGGTSVTITGTNLTGATAVSFGSTAATTFTVNTASQITATSPAHAAGTVDVTVTTPGGTSTTGAGDQFTYVAGPVITDVSPASGPTAGGTSVAISGSGFTGASAVSFGGTAAAGYTVDNDSQITATSPAHAAGTVDVSVTASAQTSPNTAADDFTFVAAPTVTGVSPASGPTAGGTSVTITGTDLTGATAVSFGASPAAAFTVNGATQITATSPAHAAGPVDVTVTTAGGTSATSLADAFTFVAPPTVTNVDPSMGPDTGGTSVTITGTDLTGTTAVSFGATAAASYTVDSDTQVTATSPAHAAGTVDVTVTTPFGTSTAGAADEFTYTTVSTACSGPCITVGDKSQMELNLNKGMAFSVTLSEPATQQVTVDYTIVSGTATGAAKPGNGADFKTKTKTLVWKLNSKGVTGITKTISATVLGDTTPEPDETLTVMLSNPTGGYSIGPGTGTGDCGLAAGCATGTILNDDGITSDLVIGVGDGSIFAARNGKQALKLPLTLSAKAATPVTITYTVVPGTATYSKKEIDGGDIGGVLTKTVTFSPGATLKQIPVKIWADPSPDPTETFTVVLTSPNGNGTTVVVVRDTGTGTIRPLS